MTTHEQDALEHIRQVSGRLAEFRLVLIRRSSVHDQSKLEEPELSGYQGLSEALKRLEYGTPEHRAAFAPFKSIIDHHYAANSHHPEHWPNGVNDMSLVDVVEMLCDWKAASERPGGDFAKSLEVSISRFHINDQLASILRNTAERMGWL